MTTILGLSGFYHDSAAAIVVDGAVVAAAQEERFTRVKHDPRFPAFAIQYCLKEAGIDESKIDYIVFYEKPLRKFERLIETYLAYAPRGFASFKLAIPTWLKEKMNLRKEIRNRLPRADKARLLFTDHHESHAASAFFPSPYDEAAILTVDGVGEWTTTAWGIGKGNQMELRQEVRFPHSLGLLYSAFTYYCGFRVNSGEYKLMGLAPYGEPKYSDIILDKILRLNDDGSFQLNMLYFNYCEGLTMTSPEFHKLFGGLPRLPEATIEQKHMDLAASIQLVTETAMIRLCRHIRQQSGMKNLVLAGGVALNCVANGKILREGIFDSLWIQPAAGDAGGALGAALFAAYQLLNLPREPKNKDAQRGSFLGPAFSNTEIETFLKNNNIAYQKMEDDGLLNDRVCELLEEGKIVGWFQGRMEFGPRALGARSILGDPRNPAMQSRMNVKIKFRESFRPFAPIVLKEEASNFFDIASQHESPYMLLVADVLQKHRTTVDSANRVVMAKDPDLCKRVNVARSSIPAVTHVDYSARLQTVDAERNARLHKLLSRFFKRTGCPILVNTSFNVRGEPIVCTPADAYRCFQGTDMDALILEDFVLTKDVSGKSNESEQSKYLAQFQLD